MTHRRTMPSVAALGLAALALAACGSKDKSSSSSSSSSTSGGGSAPKASTLPVSIKESGKKASFTVAKTAKGGLTTVTLKNEGKQPHSVQLIRIEGNHTVAQALKIVNGNQEKTPDWLRAEGGVASTSPGSTGAGIVNLPPGNYAMTELGGPGAGKPASAALKITPGTTGPLPKTATTIVGAETGKDKYAWQVQGALHTGANKLTFKSGGADAIHFIGAFRVKGNPSQKQILKGLASNGKPPAFVDSASFTTTAVLDGGLSQVTGLEFTKPGTYVLFCPLADRHGGKPHFLEGMLKTVQVK